ncbi:PREDICTED: uncharacterized protein LOC18601334 [Theobroma cacao]|uniref:Uncharacterized protein LOC18601334 n=1 Tax=Theobroma cacao TaxID=3641 RepID=A0AB32V7Z3_THECC|nr:PREDICTED: uncharacterized protein LOC18601334 [Theobroma cacao]
MASTAAARAVIFSRITALSAKPLPPSLSRFLPIRRNRPSSAVTVSCLNGGGVYDDYFVSTQKSNLDRGFLVIANMLKHIEPLDASVISKGVSDSAKESMKRTISAMLGILPSDQFSVLVSLSKPPLHRLLFSSIITGYTLWNAEYRISLMRNLERAAPAEETDEGLRRRQREAVEEKREKRESGSAGFEELEKIRPRVFGDLSPEALNYIEKLQAELSDVEAELKAQKKENVRIECDRENRNDLLEYLRSLDANMVTELSQPSSVQVEEIIHQLVQNVLQRFFKDELTSDFMRDSGIVNTGNHQDASDENCGTVGTSRDYLAKLLFWCMLLGHHLRGLENRLQLSCVVGLL